MNRTSRGYGLLLLGICLFFCGQQAVAFEGDYVWEERFQASLAKARAGNTDAQFDVGEMYLRGQGTKPDDMEALSWFILSARQGNLKAAYKVGYIYLHSETVPQSPQSAIPWLKKGVEADYPPAQYELGMVYGLGLTGKWNSKRALILLGRARSAGYEPAVEAFDRVVGQLVKANNHKQTH